MEELAERMYEEQKAAGLEGDDAVAVRDLM